MKEEKAKMQEAMLLEKVRSGDNDAVALLYKTHYPAIYHFIINNSGDEEEAAEIYQQAFIILYEKLQEEDFLLLSSPGTYLYAISRNLWLATLKERRRFTAGSPELHTGMTDEEAQIQQLINREKDFEAMNISLELLGEPCKTLLKAFYHEMMSMEQIAEKMGYTNADNAKNQKYKCLQRLRRIFEKQSLTTVDKED